MVFMPLGGIYTPWRVSGFRHPIQAHLGFNISLQLYHNNQGHITIQGHFIDNNKFTTKFQLNYRSDAKDDSEPFTVPLAVVTMAAMASPRLGVLIS